MPTRSTISQLVQIGVETTPGTLVAANKQLSGLTIEPGIEAESDEFKPTGAKYNYLVVPNREWSRASLGGKPCYDELPYIFACVLGNPAAVTTVQTTGKQWVFTPSTSAEDVIKTLTVEQGAASRAHRFGFGLITEYGMTFGRDAVDHDGAMIGTRIEDNITLTATPTALPLVPITPGSVDIYCDTTAAGLGTTKLPKGINFGWSISDRFNPAWFINSALASFSDYVEAEPTNEATLNVAADATGMGFLTQLRAGDTRFIRVKATGPVIGAGPAAYSFQLDLAVKVNAGNDFSDNDGVFGIEWPLTVVHDPTWGKSMVATVVNSLAAL